MRGELSLKTSDFKFWKAAQTKSETKEIQKAQNSADKSRLQIFFPANLSGISISLSTWEWHLTHLNPSLRLQVGFVAAERGLLSPLHHSGIYQGCANGSKSLRYGQQDEDPGPQTAAASNTHGHKFFETTRRAMKTHSFTWKYASLFLSASSSVEICKVEHEHNAFASPWRLPVLSSDTPVELVSKCCCMVWTPFHPCNSNRSDFYAAQITSYTL